MISAWFLLLLIPFTAVVFELGNWSKKAPPERRDLHITLTRPKGYDRGWGGTTEAEDFKTYFEECSRGLEHTPEKHKEMKAMRKAYEKQIAFALSPANPYGGSEYIRWTDSY